MQDNIVMTILLLVSLLEEFHLVLPNLIVVDARLNTSWESELKLWTTQVDVINYISESIDLRKFIQQAKFNFPNHYNKRCPCTPSDSTRF
jgi:SNF2 family DNA or RNA helicase